MTGIGIIDKIITAIGVIVAIASAGVFIYTELIFKRHLPEDDEEFRHFLNRHALESSGKTFKLDKLIINLNSRKTRLRFLDIRIHILPFKDRQFEIIENNRALIYDTIIDIAGSMQAEDINTVAGKILLELRIKKEVNSLLGRPVIKRLFFTTFVVQ